MTQNRQINYGVNTPGSNPAPVPFSTKKVLGSSDYSYNLGQLAYQDTTSSWVIYNGNSSWGAIAGGMFATSYAGNAGTAIPSAHVLNVVGTAGQINVTGAGNTLTLSLTGGGTAVDSFAPDTGTNPVAPDAAGLISLKGQATPSISGIQVTGGTNSLSLSMLSPFEGDFSFTQSNVALAGTRKITVTNSDNSSATSNAQVIAIVGGASAGDPASIYNVNGVTTWSTGIDNSDSDALVIAASATLGTSNTWRMSTTGIRNLPLQPAFSAYNSVARTNVTGDGTIYTVIFDTSFFDQNSNYNATTGVFTAPVTGIYFFSANIGFSNLDVGDTEGVISINTSTASYSGALGNYGAMREGLTGSNTFEGSVTALSRLSAGDTVHVSVLVNGSTKTVTVEANNATDYRTAFHGFLIC